MRTMFLAEASGGVKQEELRKTWKEYIKAADPFVEEEIKRADKKKMETLQKEVARGAFGVVPLVDTRDEQVILRDGPRLRKPYAIRKRRAK